MQKRMVQAYSRFFPELAPMLEKNGVAGIVKTPARKSRDQPFPPVAEAEYLRQISKHVSLKCDCRYSRAICTNHVIDGSHVDGVVRYTDNGSEDHGACGSISYVSKVWVKKLTYPMKWWTLNCPCKSDQSYR